MTVIKVNKYRETRWTIFALISQADHSWQIQCNVLDIAAKSITGIAAVNLTEFTEPTSARYSFPVWVTCYMITQSLY